MFSIVVTLFQKYRKSTKYIHNLGIAPPLFEICPRVGFSGRNLSLNFFFLHPTVVSVYMKNASLALKILSKALTYSLAILKLWYEKKAKETLWIRTLYIKVEGKFSLHCKRPGHVGLAFPPQYQSRNRPECNH